MDPGLQELILSSQPEQEVEAIIRLKHPDRIPENVRIVSRFGSIATCRLKTGNIYSTWSDEAVYSMKAPRYVSVDPEPAGDINQEDQEEGVAEYERRPNIPATGKGVVVGIIDWGFDFTHPNFLTEDGQTRFLAIWDQTEVSDDPALKFGYGKVHSREAINQALRSKTPFESLGYHPAKGDPTDEGAHGTHVLDIAAGNGQVGQSGMAPDAEIIGVHLSAGNTRGLASLGDSVGILEAIDFISQVAGHLPLVINMSVGMTGGEHQGKSLVEQGMDAFLKERSGRCIVQSTGNYYLSGTHSSGRVSPGGVHSLIWEVNEFDKTPNELEVWYSGKDRFIVALKAPNTHELFQAAQGERRDIIIDNNLVGRLYHRAFEPNTGDHHIDIFLYKNAPAGEWKVNIIGEEVVDGRFHAWIERDGACHNCQSRFDSFDVDPRYTTGTICNGLHTIAVGAVNPYSNDYPIAPFSSSGPTADGRQKPNLVAPGSRIEAARSSTRTNSRSDGALTYKSGSSMAAPHVTGAVAVLFEAAGELLSIEMTRKLLLTSTHKIILTDEETGFRYGDGVLDMGKMVERVLEKSFTQDALLTAPYSFQNGMIMEDLKDNTISQIQDTYLMEADPDIVSEQTQTRDIRFVKNRDTRVRTAPPNLVDTGKTIPVGKLLEVTQSVVKSGKIYVLVKEVLPFNQSKDARQLGWTAESNLRSNNASALNWQDLKQEVVNKANAEYAFWNIPNSRFETNSITFDRQRAYWRIAGLTPTDTDLSSSNWQNGVPDAQGIRRGGHAWSAVFISWVLQQAGAGEYFLYSASHSCYTVWARNNQLTNYKENPFWAYGIEELEAAWPEPGDIICKNRSNGRLTIDSVTCGASSHCDIIISVDRQNFRMVTIGGNVGNRVARRTITLNAKGFVDKTANWQIQNGGSGSQRDYFALIKIRTPRAIHSSSTADSYFSEDGNIIDEPDIIYTNHSVESHAINIEKPLHELEQEVQFINSEAISSAAGDCDCTQKQALPDAVDVISRPQAEWGMGEFSLKESIDKLPTYPKLSYLEAAKIFDQYSFTENTLLTETSSIQLGTILARPGEKLSEVKTGDIIINRALGEGKLTFQHVVHSDPVFDDFQGYYSKGKYVKIDNGEQWLKIADSRGIVESNILIFKGRSNSAENFNETSFSWPAFNHELVTVPKLSETEGSFKKLKLNEIEYLALEGGGGKGLVYLGAIEALEKGKVLQFKDGRLNPNGQVKGISGASAGAITAVALSVGYNTKDLRDLLMQFNFNEFFDFPGFSPKLPMIGKNCISTQHGHQLDDFIFKILEKAIENLFNVKGSESTENLVSEVTFPNVSKKLMQKLSTLLQAALVKEKDSSKGIGPKLLSPALPFYLRNLKNDFGLFPGCNARQFFDDLIFRKMKPGKKFRNMTFKQHYDEFHIDLVLTGSNLEKGTSEYFSRKTTPNLPVADAARISMSLPFIFKPYRIDKMMLNNSSFNFTPKEKQILEGVWVDGGLWNNIPIKAFGVKNTAHPKTLGIRLSHSESTKIENFGDFIMAFLKNHVLFGSGESGVSQSSGLAEQIITLETGNIKITEFNPPIKELEELIKKAQVATVEYFLD